MSSDPGMDDSIRKRIIADPAVLLEDTDIMRALVGANDRSMGGNVVDLRGIAMERLEARLDRLEDTHRSVIAAAYDNLAGTNQVHRAVLRMMEATRFDEFLSDLGGEVADILRVDSMKLVLETAQPGDKGTQDAVLERLSPVLVMAEPGFVETYLTRGRQVPARQVTLRQLRAEDAADHAPVHGMDRPGIRSEACLRLDLGAGRLPGMLVMGSDDPQQFGPQQGTDLLGFFAAVFDRTLRRWLAQAQ